MRDVLRGAALNSGDGSEPDGGKPAVSDELLMAAFARGSNDAFGELFSRYKQPVFGFFRRRVTDPAVAEELTQETFVAVLGAASRYEPSATFRTYLYAIGFNVLRAHRRKAAFRGMFAGVAEQEPAARNSLDAEVVLRDAMRRLDRVDREILLLREFEELSYAEIAELLKLPLNTVRSRLFRARMALRGMLTAPAPGRAASEFTEGEERV
jgi:RNA polymerase sigma factor (sigma-70 family)